MVQDHHECVQPGKPPCTTSRAHPEEAKRNRILTSPRSAPTASAPFMRRTDTALMIVKNEMPTVISDLGIVLACDLDAEAGG